MANTLYRMKRGEAISTKTLNALCFALDCEVSDILEFLKEKHPFRCWNRVLFFLIT